MQEFLYNVLGSVALFCSWAAGSKRQWGFAVGRQWHSALCAVWVDASWLSGCPKPLFKDPAGTQSRSQPCPSTFCYFVPILWLLFSVSLKKCGFDFPWSRWQVPQYTPRSSCLNVFSILSCVKSVVTDLPLLNHHEMKRSKSSSCYKLSKLVYCTCALFPSKSCISWSLRISWWFNFKLCELQFNGRSCSIHKWYSQGHEGRVPLSITIFLQLNFQRANLTIQH